MSPNRTGGSQSTTCTGPGDGEQIESLTYGHIIMDITKSYLECNVIGLSPFPVGYM